LATALCGSFVLKLAPLLFPFPFRYGSLVQVSRHSPLSRLVPFPLFRCSFFCVTNGVKVLFFFSCSPLYSQWADLKGLSLFVIGPRASFQFASSSFPLEFCFTRLRILYILMYLLFSSVPFFFSDATNPPPSWRACCLFHIRDLSVTRNFPCQRFLPNGLLPFFPCSPPPHETFPSSIFLFCFSPGCLTY